MELFVELEDQAVPVPEMELKLHCVQALSFANVKGLSLSTGHFQSKFHSFHRYFRRRLALH